jgi:hypothetical protein
MLQQAEKDSSMRLHAWHTMLMGVVCLLQQVNVDAATALTFQRLRRRHCCAHDSSCCWCVSCCLLSMLPLAATLPAQVVGAAGMLLL